jgi:hypothetical protein
MNIGTTRGDANIEELSQRLFGSEAKQRTDLTERLMELNPHLRNIANLPPGTPIIIPDDDDSSTPPPADSRHAQAVRKLWATLEALETRQLERLANRKQVLEQTVKLAEDDRIKQAAGTEHAQRLADVLAAAGQQIIATDQKRAAFLEDLKGARAALPLRKRRAVRH